MVEIFDNIMVFIVCKLNFGMLDHQGCRDYLLFIKLMVRLVRIDYKSDEFAGSLSIARAKWLHVFIQCLMYLGQKKAAQSLFKYYRLYSGDLRERNNEYLFNVVSSELTLKICANDEKTQNNNNNHFETNLEIHYINNFKSKFLNILRNENNNKSENTRWPVEKAQAFGMIPTSSQYQGRLPLNFDLVRNVVLMGLMVFGCENCVKQLMVNKNENDGIIDEACMMKIIKRNFLTDKYYTCKRCDARYCSKKCQKWDWKFHGHKNKCH